MKWGIAGYGRIAKKFITNLNAAEGEKLHAIATRSGYNFVPSEVRAYDNYEELYHDSEIDIIYVSTTHNTHKEITIAALNAGKHVLCEKPMGISLQEVNKMIVTAQHNGKFLMEAIWSRYLPAYIKTMKLIKDGTIGKVELVQANFGFMMNPEDPKARLTEPGLAGGAIWDVGIYPIMLALDIYNESPIDIQATGKLGQTGVEHRALINMVFGEDRMAQLSCGFDWTTYNQAIIHGNEGYIKMIDFWKCEDFELVNKNGSKKFHLPVTSTGMYHEILACRDLITNHCVESPIVSWKHSQLIASCMDRTISILRS